MINFAMLWSKRVSYRDFVSSMNGFSRMFFNMFATTVIWYTINETNSTRKKMVQSIEAKLYIVLCLCQKKLTEWNMNTNSDMKKNNFIHFIDWNDNDVDMFCFCIYLFNNKSQHSGAFHKLPILSNPTLRGDCGGNNRKAFGNDRFGN